MQTIVSIRPCEDYDPARLKATVESALEDLMSGPGSFVKRGERILLKPNLLKSAQPSQAVVTHPAFVEAVASLVIDAGATPLIGDSPPLGNLPRVLSKSGYDPFMKRLGISPVPFVDPVPVEFGEGRLFRRIDLSREVFEFDAVINLAKLKTHSQMVLTLAVKNLFGTVIGTDKAAWHLRAGKDYDGFATALVQILDAVKPTLSMVDGILGMEGNGPNSGIPRHLGIVGASADAVALDASICRLLGLPVETVRTCVIGESLGVGVAAKDRIRVVGSELDRFPLTDFLLPKSMTMTWNLSRRNPFRKFLENHLVTRPRIDSSACSGCKICLEHCPPGAITEEDGEMEIDYRKCISCFCCHELCSGDAIRIVQPRLARLLSSISR
jgi:uncharacterized protein (DUF362 family)/NAD-dependent dihydropyrimidine dehydrogenase PreA subunit